MSSGSQMSVENVPVSTVEDSQQDSALISPSIKKSFFKKNIEDGMDKYVQMCFNPTFINYTCFKPEF